MTGEEPRDGPAPIPAGPYPDPVLEYRLSDGEPVVVGVNRAFRSAFGTVSAGTPVADGFDEVGISPATAPLDVAARILDGERFAVQVDGGDPDAAGAGATTEWRATVVDGPNTTGGHIVFGPDSGSTSSGRRELGLDHVASVVSHDLRNPLEVARTRLRTGRETGDDDHFDHVATAHDRMERIIEDVLTLARGEDTVDPSEEVDLTAVAEAAWDAVESDGVTLTVVSPLPTAVVDPDRTGRVFENLFRNAVEHGSTSARRRQDAGEEGSPDGQSAPDDRGGDGAPEVRVGSLDSRSDTGFYVADDGPGIPPDERDAVFEPGYSTHEHGTGLGLAIVEQIADAHGWSLRVTSAETGGARIEIRDL